MFNLAFSIWFVVAAGVPLSGTSLRRPSLSLSNITRMDLPHAERALSGPQMGVNFPDPSLIFGDGS
jgi:hypothetical protein